MFVVGAPRSGTTLMRLLINAHPNIAISNETHFFPRVYERFASDAATGWSMAVEFFMQRCSIERPADYTVSREMLENLLEPDYARLLSLPLQQWAISQGKSRWGEKTPGHVFFTDLLMRFFPDANFVVMQRDPRAVVASMNRFDLIASNDAVFNARLWYDTWTRGKKILCDSVPTPQRMTVRFEELILEPDAVVRRICDFLGEEFSPAMLRFYETAREVAGAKRQPNLMQPIGGDPFAWREQLSKREVSIVEAVCGSVMSELRYEKEGQPLGLTQRVQVRVKIAYIDAKQFQHRGERYHPVLYPPFGRLKDSLRAFSAPCRRQPSAR